MIIAGEKDHAVFDRAPSAPFKREERNQAITEYLELENRDHSPTIDSGWRDVCDKALAFVQRFV